MPKKICAADASQALLRSSGSKPSGRLTNEAGKRKKFNCIDLNLIAGFSEKQKMEYQELEKR